VSNVSSKEKKQLVLALGSLGWSLRRIQRETGIRRETISAYLKEAGVDLRLPRGSHGNRFVVRIFGKAFDKPCAVCRENGRQFAPERDPQPGPRPLGLTLPSEPRLRSTVSGTQNLFNVT
jgi:hypothetical protein